MEAGPRRSIAYAQNFLRSHRLVARLIDRSSIGRDDFVLEIGPGRGLITQELARRCREVRAIEKDALLAARLERRFAAFPPVRIEAADILHVDLPCEPYKVFASIPFNCTAAIVTRLTSPVGRAAAPRGPLARRCRPTRPERAPDDAYLVVQREAAQRCLGVPRESLYSVLLKPWFAPLIVHRFRRMDFVPAPGVEVVMLRLRKRGPPLVAPPQAQAYRDFVSHGFTAWQPSLRAAFGGIFDRSRLLQILRDLAIDLDARPSLVPFEDWLALFRRLDGAGECRAFHELRELERRRQRQRSRERRDGTLSRRRDSAGKGSFRTKE